MHICLLNACIHHIPALQMRADTHRHSQKFPSYSSLALGPLDLSRNKQEKTGNWQDYTDWVCWLQCRCTDRGVGCTQGMNCRVWSTGGVMEEETHLCLLNYWLCSWFNNSCSQITNLCSWFSMVFGVRQFKALFLTTQTMPQRHTLMKYKVAV